MDFAQKQMVPKLKIAFSEIDFVDLFLKGDSTCEAEPKQNFKND